MYRAAMQSILSELARQGRLVLVDSLVVEQPKTKIFADKLKGLDLTSVLIVADSVDENLYLASRNIPAVSVCDAVAVDPVSLISYEKVMLTVPALKKIEEMLG